MTSFLKHDLNHQKQHEHDFDIATSLCFTTLWYKHLSHWLWDEGTKSAKMLMHFRASHCIALVDISVLSLYCSVYAPLGICHHCKPFVSVVHEEERICSLANRRPNNELANLVKGAKQRHTEVISQQQDPRIESLSILSGAYMSSLCLVLVVSVQRHAGQT